MAKLILDFLRRIYGKNSENQFRIKASKFGFPVEDVVQIACLVYMEKKDAHDAKKGELAPFLWGHLNKTLLRTSLSQLNFAKSLDDGSEFSQSLLKELDNTPANEEQIDPVAENPGITENDVLRECLEFANRISGKSIVQFAAETGKHKRTIYNQIAEKCAAAQAERLKFFKR